jgi:glycosyltransferase involved in cell wall biosynthesis
MAQHLRIGLIAPPWVPVPPPAYGGTEAVIDRLAVGLQELGHDVLLFATGDSTCPVPTAWIREEASFDLLGKGFVEAQHVVHAYNRLADCDIVHDHTLIGPLVGGPRRHGRLVVTNHGPFTAETGDIFRAFADQAALVAISHDQASRAPIPMDAVIHHGLRPDELAVGLGDGDYVLFLGRFSPEKGAREAIEIARAAGVPLILAAKMREQLEIDYFHDAIEPLLDEGARYVGEVSGQEKAQLIGSARALLNPIRWPEPFGLVMIEALACGTPVLARRAGASPEIIEEGVTGFVCDTDEELRDRIAEIDSLDRQACRDAVLGRFSARRMVEAHLALYQSVLQKARSREGSRSSIVLPPKPRRETAPMSRTEAADPVGAD